MSAGAVRTIAVGAGKASGRDIAGLLSMLAFAAYALLVLANSIAKPVANWDMIAYQASVLERSGLVDPAALHAESYRLTQHSVTPGEFRDLTAADRFRQRWATDPAAFASLLPMYRVKGGYIQLLEAGSAFGDTIAFARWVSRISVLALFGAVAFAFWRVGAARYLVLAIPVFITFNVRDLATMTTPDALSAALAVIPLAMMCARSDLRIGAAEAAMLALAVWFRPDMLLLAAGFPAAVALAAFAHDRQWRSIAARTAWPMAAAALGVAAYALTKHGVEHPGWWPHFWFSIIQQQETMAGFAPSFSVTAYVDGLVRVVLRMLRDEAWPWVVMAMGAGGLLWFDVRKAPPTALALALIALGWIVGRALVFPLGDARLAVVPLLALALAAAGFQRAPGDAERG